MFGAIMGCLCSKGVSANESNKSEKHLFGTKTRDDVVVELAEESDTQLAQRNNKINTIGNVGVYQDGMSYNDQRLSVDTDSLLRKALRVSEFQEKQMLVKFEEKPQLEQEEILAHLYMNWGNLQQDSSVIEALKGTKFVRSADGELYKPKDLCDPGDALLMSLFSGEANKFPGESFASDGWLNILRKIGLQNTADADTLLTCARKVELLGAKSMSNMKSEVSIEIWSLAETLMSAVLKQFDVFNFHNLFNILGKIACIPAEKGFPFESGKKGVKRVLCSYSEAILLKDWPLAWCVAPIISRDSLVPPEYSWEALELRSPPPFTVVSKHLQDEGWFIKSYAFVIEEACFQLLKYLDTIWGTLSSSDVSKLRDIAFIPVDNVTRIASCNSLLSCLTIDLSPLAFELPSCYLPFVKILKKMGLHDMLSISSALMFLLTFKKSCRHKRLNPNELRAVIEILHYIYNETVGQQNSDSSIWKSKLVVPDDACRLVRPKSCVYIDSYGSRYMKHIDCSKLSFVHHDVSEMLCLAFGIRKLSDVVVEELDRAEHLQTLEDIGSVSLAAIRLKLLSRSFQVSVLSMVNNFSSNTPGSKNIDFPTLKRSLESIAERLQFVQRIYTRFWLLPKNLDITRTSKHSIFSGWESGSSHRALYFVDCSYTCMLIAKPPSYMSVIDVVAIIVSNVVGSQIPLPIGSLFLCPLESEVAIVDILKLSCDERVMDSVGCGTGFLGRDLLPVDAKKVQLKPTRPFYKGEIVAWQSQNGEKLKYGRIPEDVRPSAWQALYQFNLETSPGKTGSIISSRVFWFGNFLIGSKSSTPVISEDVDKAVNSICAQQPLEPGKMNGRNQRQSIKELEQGRVSPEELSQVIEEMMSRAGIRIDMEKQYLLETTIYLQERLKESQLALVFEKEKSQIVIKEAETAEAALLCRICLTNEIDTIVLPCGHVLCHRCSSAVSRCPFCRIELSAAIKIFV